MNDRYAFLPAPRHVTWLEGTFAVPDRFTILLDPRMPQVLRFTGKKAATALSASHDTRCGIIATSAAPGPDIALTLLVMPEAVRQPEGYRLRITPTGITIRGHDAAGVFYGVCTLRQLLMQAAGEPLPCVDIRDWPDFPARGILLDISRDRVPTMETLYGLVDRLASWKLNQLQLYTEHTFAYRAHAEVWADASPMTGEEILELDAYCRERFIELVPNQNSFGHMERWLKHERYAPLAETHEMFDTPWGIQLQGPFGLAPEAPGSFELIGSLYDELLPHFSSRQINVGLDETIDLGQGASKTVCKERGAGRVYLDFLLRLYNDVTGRGRAMQYWGDIVIHYPELIAELPKDAIALEWGYEFDHPFGEHGEMFAAAGVPYHVCPGTASWNSIAGRTDNALGNLLKAAENGLAFGATGYLVTDWGDSGHWQHLSISDLGFSIGAAYAWCLEANRDVDVPGTVSRFAFGDPTGAIGRVAYELGNVYQVAGIPRIHNASILFHLLQNTSDLAKHVDEVPPAGFETAMAKIDELMPLLAQAEISRRDADLVEREFTSAARLLRIGCRRALQILSGDDTAALRAEFRTELEDAIAEHTALWLARSRHGGLKDSLSHFDSLLNEWSM